MISSSADAPALRRERKRAMRRPSRRKATMLPLIVTVFVLVAGTPAWAAPIAHREAPPNGIVLLLAEPPAAPPPAPPPLPPARAGLPPADPPRPAQLTRPPPPPRTAPPTAPPPHARLQ